jgi:hypothetical protein
MFCFILKLLVLDNWDAGNQALESWSICVVVLYFFLYNWKNYLSWSQHPQTWYWKHDKKGGGKKHEIF